MTLLLDTCAAIWLVAGVPVSAKAEAALNDAYAAEEPVFVSPITAWEVGLLALRGRFASPLSPQAWFARLLGIGGVRLAPMPYGVLIDSSFLPGKPPNDPADRIIIATARENAMTVVTRDRLILNYQSAGHVLALAC